MCYALLMTTASPRFQSSPGGYGYSSDNAQTNAMTHNSSSFFSGKQLHSQQAHVQQHIQHTQLQHQLQHQVQQQQHAAAGRTAAANEAATLRTYNSAGCISLQASHLVTVEMCRSEPVLYIRIRLSSAWTAKLPNHSRAVAPKCTIAVS
jgi:hypothetical protein